MPDVQTLDELKAENAKAELEAEQATAAQTEENEVETAEVNEDESVNVAEHEQDKSESETVEAWMQSDESDNEGSFDNSDMAAMRKKYQAKAEKKLNEKDDEIAKLQAELNSLKSPSSQPTSIPKLEDFDYDDAAYNEAMNKYIQSQVSSQVSTVAQTEQQKQVAEQQRKQLDESVNSHYERAAKLAQESGIDSEVYKQSDLNVRQAVASIPQFQNNANDVVDHLISLIGDGSEKVMYFLGRNNAERNRLLTAIQSDPTGIKAGMIIGELKTKVTQPVRKISKASKPAKAANGDGTPQTVTNWKKKYDKANNPQERLEVKWAARKAGENTSGW